MIGGADWLVREVSDLLESSTVGLYEFVGIVRGAFPDMSDDEARRWSADAVKQLLEQGRGRLVLLRWPSDDIVGTIARFDESAWEEPTATQPYAAIAQS